MDQHSGNNNGNDNSSVMPATYHVPRVSTTIIHTAHDYFPRRSRATHVIVGTFIGTLVLVVIIVTALSVSL